MKKTTTFALLGLFFLVAGCQGRVDSGLDRTGEFTHLFQGKRIGIITNHTAYNRRNQFIVDVFQQMPGLRIVALFSPEHGLFGSARAGAQVDDRTDPTYGLPVYSLYGASRKPDPNQLKNIDVLVFDIQDVGARFYTYISTLALALEAAGQQNKRFVVLDRPNPINGRRLEGPLLEKKWASFIGLYPIPVRHGMTVGELAKMFNGEGWLAGAVRADLTVIPMKGWRRSMWHDQTGLAFVKPSPNMPDLETAIIYPGLCLWEGTNLSEGRGTPLPFRQFGAPWIDETDLAERLNKLHLPGATFQPTTFTPTASKHKNRLCRGVRINVDRNTFVPFDSTVQIVNLIYHLYPNRFEWRADHFDRLCGTSSVRQAIINRTDLKQLQNGWQSDLKKFQRIRQKYLIYPK